MTARNWDALGRDQRRRYEKRGITRRDYEAGISLTVARGHGKTPEHPERAEKNPEKYPEYVTAESKAKRRERDRLLRERKAKIIEFVFKWKRDEFGDTPKWNPRRAYKSVKLDPATGRDRPVKDLIAIEAMVKIAITDGLDYEEITEMDYDQESAFFYH
jgi:hypothetical protein